MYELESLFKWNNDQSILSEHTKKYHGRERVLVIPTTLKKAVIMTRKILDCQKKTARNWFQQKSIWSQGAG
ncbi:MAG: hypothetical protein ACFFD4_20590 [Candidatus Odinarchaeota archaeon]